MCWGMAQVRGLLIRSVGITRIRQKKSPKSERNFENENSSRVHARWRQMAQCSEGYRHQSVDSLISPTATVPAIRALPRGARRGRKCRSSGLSPLRAAGKLRRVADQRRRGRDLRQRDRAVRFRKVARDRMALAAVDQLGLLLGADGLRLPAARSEAAARRWIGRAWHFAAEDDALAHA